ncbi:hypothetical protein MBRA1_001229 [Malassezia brasiliensis]|uniref:Uncharacterized protein n=1 Tax=Malassezia brasiliensis TaxID=1821822 RepID=A0AAF0DS04_9BASI|nr:hypothetical protein MBRA1_001229 [Malassezia brasiliensis]
MDTHLDALQRTLDALHTQLAYTKEEQQNPSYFTNAVLRTNQLDILELIRDADQLEASLFAYPARDDGAERGGEGPLTPQPRAVHIPTPLRRSATDAPGAHSARFYLEAAEKLMQSYHNAPRARKHIRMLLKRDGEVQRHIQRYASTIEHAKNTQPTPGKARPNRARVSDNGELRQLRDEIQREKMEIVALENMLAELEATPAPQPAEPTEATAAPGKESTREATASPSKPERSAREQPSSSRAAARTPKTPAPSTPSKASLAQSVRTRTPERTPATARLRRTLDSTPRFAQSVSQPPSATPARQTRRPLAQSVASPSTPNRRAPPASPARAHGSPATRAPATPTTRTPGSPAVRAPGSPAVRAQAPGMPTRPTLLPLGQVPTSSAELERITALLWTRFGEALRYVSAEERAPFTTTFALLASLECCGQDPSALQTDAAASADDSVHAPSAVTSLATQSSAGMLLSAPLSVNTVVMAHVILLLFRAPPPHTLTLPTIKTLTESWWRQRGQDVFRATSATPALSHADTIRQAGLDASEVETGGDTLGSRAVYGLVAKKLLRIHRAGGAATIQFA